MTADDDAREQILSWAAATRVLELRIDVSPPNAPPTAIIPHLLAHPSMQQIRVLAVPPHAETIRIASQLTRLHTLQCSRTGAPSTYEPLIRAPTLTALTVFDPRGHSCLTVLSQLPLLRSLRLANATFLPTGLFPSICSSPTISARLQHLTIGCWDRTDLSDESLSAELAASFPHLRALSLLRWLSQGNVDPILLTLHHARRIKQFEISTMASFGDAALVALLTACPRLRCVIDPCSLEASVTPSMRDRIEAFQAQFPSRLVLK